MYEVVRIYGDNEPWWFFENWERDIVEKSCFKSFAQAKQYFTLRFSELVKEFSNVHFKKGYLGAFWEEMDVRWCEECDEFLQQYHGLLLLSDGKMLPLEKRDFCMKMVAKELPSSD